MSGRRIRVFAGVCLVVSLASTTASSAETQHSLVEYVQSRDDLPPKLRRSWLKAVRLRFGGAALEPSSESRVELDVAKEILAAAMFWEVAPERGARAAWEGYRGAIGYVPPPIAVHYQLLSLQGRTPKGRPIDLAFDFPEFYNDEIAPELVAYWEDALARGTIPEHARAETIEALQKTRVLMRPLLEDKIELRERLHDERRRASEERQTQLDRDIESLDQELERSFGGVPRSPQKDPADERAPVPKPERRPSRGGKPVPPVPAPEPTPTPGAPDLDPNRDRSFETIHEAHARLRRSVQPWLGTPYRWGGTRKGVGADCSGFTQGVFREGFDVRLPRVSRDQFRTGQPVRREGLRPGDLVFFDMKDAGRVSHVGIYMGNGRFAHASYTRGVVVADLGRRIYQRSYRGARRVLRWR